MKKMKKKNKRKESANREQERSVLHGKRDETSQKLRGRKKNGYG